MQILLTGGTGFIGQALLPALQRNGHQLLLLSRQPHSDSACCRYVTSLDDIPAEEPIDAVINLAGASLAARRWTQSYKAEIIDSRLETTRQLVQMMMRMDECPRVLLSASAVGIYGCDDGEVDGEPLSETSRPMNRGFAQTLCADWEAQALEAEKLGSRVCALRLGVVLDRDGGALQEMAKSFSFGVASWLGSGRQWLSWIHRDDVVTAILFLLSHEELEGSFNLTAPGPLTGRRFCAALKRHHRTLVTASVPGPLTRMLIGEMATELLLNGQRVLPDRLTRAGFIFRYPDIETAFDAIYNG